MAWAVVQIAKAAMGHAANPSTIFTTQNVTTGNDIVVFASVGGTATLPIVTVTDDASGGSSTYARETAAPIGASTSKYNGTSDLGVEIWRARNVVGGKKIRVTVNPTTGFMDGDIFIAELSGGDHAAAADSVVGAVATAAAPNAGNISPSIDEEILLAFAVFSVDVGIGPDTGWTAGDSGTTDNKARWVYQIQTAKANQASQFTGTGTNFASVGISLKAAASGTTINPTGLAITVSLGTFTTQADTTITGVTGFSVAVSLGTPVVTASSTQNPTGFLITVGLGTPSTGNIRPLMVTLPIYTLISF